MQFEVEQKHRVADVAEFVAGLAARGVTLGPPIEQVDQYFAHPCRDFAKTDEALRIRTVAGQSFVTYKGAKFDTTTKTRRELELPLDPDDADGSRFSELLFALGFTPVAVVRKKRRAFRVEVSGRHIDGALDEVENVGRFVELELLADDASLEEAKRMIAELAAQLDLGPSERRSYLEMLLAKA
ncbi:MAG: class IV adenylate cyclase [Pirellulales bacterium]